MRFAFVLVVLSLAVGCHRVTVAAKPLPTTAPAAPSVVAQPAPAQAAAIEPPPIIVPEAPVLAAVEHPAPLPLEPVVHFGFDSDLLEPRARDALDGAVASWRRAGGAGRVRVEGHADEAGSDEYNLVLSLSRAASVRRYLARLGVDEGLIEVNAFGENVPADPGHSREAWAANRRAEISVVR